MKRLQVGKTKIGERTGKYEGQFVKFSIYYGNYSMPPVNGEYVHLKKDKYLALLDEFLKSPEGEEYQRPTEEEIEEACLEVVNRELKAQQSKKAKAEQKTIAEESASIKEPKPVDPAERTVRVEPAAESTKEKELLKTYKRQTTILTIAVIFLVLVVALQMLLNLYLFTR